MLLSSLNTVSDLTLSNITYDQGYLKCIHQCYYIFRYPSCACKKKKLESNTLASHPAMKVWFLLSAVVKGER